MPIYHVHTHSEVVRGEIVSAYSQCLKKRKERVWWSVTARISVDRRRSGEGLFFESEVGMELNLTGFHLLMTQPERYG
jgi:hypothetical protein